MKKSSNFLKSSKDKLTKGFNSSKCKTSLKLASSRLKLLKNKKEVQVNQMRRELGQLLESGKSQTARIRVEHVVREEKMMAAYDLLEIYCELIVARLPIIESQKNCPIDLKEAITSVVFASPRCGDIPELADARKHFTGKYGKEFITAAVELRPDCGVSRLLIEKLSAKAPDGQAKLKILTAIADEQGIKWDSNSFGASDLPVNDLLNGSNTFEKASKVHKEPSPFEYGDVRTPTAQSQVSNESLETSEEKFRSSMARQSFASPQGGTSGTLPSQSSQLEQRHSGFRSERTNAGQSFPEGGNLSNGRQNWNMEFKDAASAAQAAAESAERASMAARAAAKLSRMSERYQTESPTSQVGIEQQGYSGASIRKAEQHHHQDLADRNSGFQDNNNMMKARSPEEPDRSREKNFSKEEQVVVEKVANKPTSGKFEPEYMSGYEEDINYFGEESSSVEVNNVPSASDSRTSMDGDHIHNQKVTHEAGKNLFATADGHVVDPGNMNTNSHDAEFSVFDKSSSDGDDYDDIHFHTEPLYDDQQAKLYFPSPERKLPESSLTSQIFVQRRYSPPESPKSFNEPFGGKPHEFNSTHAAFDDSDGMDSETEAIDGSEIHSEHFQTRGSRSSEARGTERENYSHLSNGRDLEYSYSYGKGVNTNDASQSRLSVSNVAKDNSHLLHSTGAWPDDEKTQSNSDSDNGTKLEFGKLRGGFRHKGYITPPYTNVYQNTNPTSVNTSDKVSASQSANLNQGNKSGSRMPTPSYKLVDTDSSEEEELSRQISSVRRKEAETKPMSKVSPPSSETNRGSQFSRRTKVSPPKMYLDEEEKKTSAIEQAPSYERKTESSINTEIPKASGGSGRSLAREEDSTNKHPSHVHPKLPDYDTIALKLQSLRMNRK